MPITKDSLARPVSITGIEINPVYRSFQCDKIRSLNIDLDNS